MPVRRCILRASIHATRQAVLRCVATKVWPPQSKRFYRALSRPVERRCEIFTVAMDRQVTSGRSCKRMAGRASRVGIATRRLPQSCRGREQLFIANSARPDQLRPTFCSKASLTRGETNSVTSPPSDATSRTRVEEINVYLSVGVRNAVSTSSVRCRFMLAS